MSYFAGILLLMIVVAVLIIAVSIIIYNKRLDKIAKGELHDTHNPIPEPKTTAEFLYKTILLVIVSISLISISTLSGMVISLRNDVDNMRNDQGELSDELYTLRSDLEEQARLVASSDWSFENVDYNTMTTDVNYSATLKQYSDDTEVTLSINGNNINRRNFARSYWVAILIVLIVSIVLGIIFGPAFIKYMKDLQNIPSW